MVTLTQQSEPRAAEGFIPVQSDVPLDDDFIAEVRVLARDAAEDGLRGTVVGEIELTWNEDRCGFDARCVIARAVEADDV